MLALMAKECSESSVATSSPTPPNWWDLHHHANSTLSSSWTDWHQHQNPNSTSDDDVSISTTSFTYASNHSALTVDSSQRFLDQPSSTPNDFISPDSAANDSHLWNHVFLNVGGNGELENGNEVGENLMEQHHHHHGLSSKSIYEPAYDYLKKMDNNWEFTSSTSFNDNGFVNHHQTLTNQNERFTKLSNLVSRWSIAPPDNAQFSSQTYFAHDLKVENELDSNGNGMEYNNCLMMNNGSVVEGFGSLMSSNASCTSNNGRNFGDSIGLSSCRFTKPLIDIQVPRPYLKSLSDVKKQALRTSSPTTMNGREKHGVTNEGKKKRSEEGTESVAKKPKNDNSTASSVKQQVPKVKIADKITALQQMVSPFGKTDTASVLYEAIGYIKFLQEQVQLLSNPYMKSHSHKDPWGGLERKDKSDMKIDLRSRGLCLVPVSCTPKVYHENTGSDYWTPAYRGCLYR